MSNFKLKFNFKFKFNLILKFKFDLIFNFKFNIKLRFKLKGVIPYETNESSVYETSISKKWKLIFWRLKVQFSIFNNFKQIKIGLGQFSIQFLIFRITEKIENWFFGNFQSIFNSLRNGKSNSMSFNRTLHFRIWVLDAIMISEF